MRTGVSSATRKQDSRIDRSAEGKNRRQGYSLYIFGGTTPRDGHRYDKECHGGR